MCHVPVSSHHTSRESLHTSGDVRIPVPVLSSGDGGGSQQNAATSSRLDSFLSTLDEAEPLVEGEERDEGEEFTWDFGTAKNGLFLSLKLVCIRPCTHITHIHTLAHMQCCRCLHNIHYIIRTAEKGCY